MLLALLACGPGPDGLYGTKPAQPLAPPEFTATESSGALRDREALLGHPTAMWFYPAAGTSG